MCGRYAASASPDALVEEFEVERDATDEPGAPVMKRPQEPAPGTPDFNVAPTKQVPVVLTRTPRGEEDAPAERQLRLLSWGLVPPWAKDLTMGNRMINARSETLFEKRTFAGPARTRRCLVPADGWYEWQASPVARTTAGKPRKQPFFMSRVDEAPLAFAGLYEFHRLGTGGQAHDWVVSFTILTRDAEPGLDRIHDRQPVVVEPEDWAAWLDPAATEDDHVLELLSHQPEGRFQAWPVGSGVSRVATNGPELVRPVPTEQLVGVVDPVTGEVVGG
ncbi:SOS response-associated peptidase [Kytococcus schroeteri]|uniref:SOS response-associated peptidase n=1 Tax=Kytococcus schroeteri TaxID=138300 RepID=UPI0035EAFBDB